VGKNADTPSEAPTDPSQTDTAAEEARQGEAALRLLARAQDQWQRHAYRWALINARAAAQLAPNNPTVSSQLDEWERESRRLADDHAAKAAAYIKKGRRDRALDQWLQALRYRTHHQPTLDALRSYWPTADTIAYVIEPGDTAAGIARRAYNDASLEYLVAYFERQVQPAGLQPGQTLLLPRIPGLPKAKPPEPEVTTKMEAPMVVGPTADHLLQQEQYPQAIEAALVRLKDDPDDPQATAVINEAYYQWALQLWAEEDLLKAQALFEQVDPAYRDVQAQIDQLQGRMQRQADIHYRQGVKFFVAENLQRAIDEWELVLRLNPQHPKARQDITNASKLLEKLEAIE
jgi:tetratricopeptide (TPR) repeat protein